MMAIQVLPELQGRDSRKDAFELADHFFLNLERGDCEYGGWGLDDKRPFGNSYVVGDIMEILGIDPSVSGGDDYAHALYDALGGFLLAEWMNFRKSAK